MLTLVAAAPSADSPLAAVRDGGDNPIWLAVVVGFMIFIMVIGVIRRKKK